VTEGFAGRDARDVDALVTDRYLDALLAAHARGTDRGPAAADPDDEVRGAADRLARDLPRLHPSFRFEEALAARLAEVAARMGMPIAAGAEGTLVPLRGRSGSAALDSAFGGGDDDLDAAEDGHLALNRPLLIGGALTSAAISIAGAAYVAWRRNRPPTSAMVRAARAVARSRPS
jgi:hypothetical protein